MIFQIDYQSGGLYTEYFNKNKEIGLDNHTVFGDEDIDRFLVEYGYKDIFMSKKVAERCLYAEKPIKCALLRLMILYEFGGIYVDADVLFKENIVNLEKDLTDKYDNRNVMLDSGSLYFVKGIKKSKFMRYLLDVYLNRDYMVTDTIMTKECKLTKFHKELMVMPALSLNKYFHHDFKHNNGS